MCDNSSGFRYRYDLIGASVRYQKFIFKDTETLTKGDLLNVESGEVDLAATNDTKLIGVANETKAGVDSTTEIEVITNVWAVYGVYDANARKVGDLLDISGTTGAQTVTTSTNGDFVVVAPSGADEETLVMIASGNHIFR